MVDKPKATRGGGGAPSVRVFAFDSVFDQHSAQEDVFAEVPHALRVTTSGLNADLYGSSDRCVSSA